MTETAVVKRKPQPGDVIHEALRKQEKSLAKALTQKGIDPAEFIVGIMTQIHTNPKLLECTPNSIILAAFRAAMVGLTIDGISGQAFLVPRNRKVRTDKGDQWIMEANLQIGYQGVLKHIHGSKEVKSVYPAVVREGDFWEAPEMTERGVVFRHKPNYDDSSGRIIGAYARVKLVKDEEPLVYYLPIERIYREHRDVSVAYKKDDPNCVWNKYEEAMVLKTVLIVAGKYLPKDTRINVLNLADRLDKDIPTLIPGEEKLQERTVTVRPDSLLIEGEAVTMEDILASENVTGEDAVVRGNEKQKENKNG
jgi:recombination protein RecT